MSVMCMVTNIIHKSARRGIPRPGVLRSGVARRGKVMDATINRADLAALSQRFRDIETRHLPDVTRWALNDMAFGVHAENKRLIDRVFDNPVRFTRNAFWVRKATRDNPVAVVERKRMVVGKHYLEVQQKGGTRRQTGIEKMLARRLPYEGLIQSVLPASIRTNAAGNIAPGALQRLLSGVGAQTDRNQNTTDASRRRNPRRARFFVPDADSHLSPGVYAERAGELTKMLHLSEMAPTYRKRFPMEEHGETVAARAAPAAVERALARALPNIR